MWHDHVKRQDICYNNVHSMVISVYGLIEITREYCVGCCENWK